MAVPQVQLAGGPQVQYEALLQVVSPHPGPRELGKSPLGSSLTPAPYEKAQASDVICKRRGRLVRAADQIRKDVVLDVRICAYVYACMHACMRYV